MNQPEMEIDVVISYEDDDYVAELKSGVRPTEVSSPLRGLVVDPELVIAGAIALRILMSGLLEWAKLARRAGFVCDTRDAHDTGGPFVFYRLNRVEKGFLLVLLPEGKERLYSLSEDRDEVADLLRQFGRLPGSSGSR